MTEGQIHVGVCMHVVGRPHRRPFIYLAQNGISLVVGGIADTDVLIDALQQARANLMSVEAYDTTGGEDTA